MEMLLCIADGSKPSFCGVFVNRLVSTFDIS